MLDKKLSFEELLELARAAYEAEDDQSEAYSDVVWLLAKRNNQPTLDKLLALTQGGNFERDFSASVLGPFATPGFYGHPTDEQPERFASTEIIEVLLEMLRVENEESVIATILRSLIEHQEQDERIPGIAAPFVQHPNEEIRLALPMGLGHYGTPEAVEMLIELSSDVDRRVRDWATFNLGSIIDEDSPAIREALMARLVDEDDETRIEALEGLAQRHDLRTVRAFIQEFDDKVEPQQSFLPSQRMLTSLREMESNPSYEENKDLLRIAIQKCEVLMDQAGRPIH